MTVVPEPITAESRTQGAADDEEQVGPAEHGDGGDGGDGGCRMSAAVCPT